MFVSDVCVQIAGISEASHDLLLTQLALRLVNVLRLSVYIRLESKILPNRRLSILFFPQDQ